MGRMKTAYNIKSNSRKALKKRAINKERCNGFLVYSLFSETRSD
jgi:hypothetical protein